MMKQVKPEINEREQGSQQKAPSRKTYSAQQWLQPLDRPERIILIAAALSSVLGFFLEHSLAMTLAPLPMVCFLLVRLISQREQLFPRA